LADENELNRKKGRISIENIKKRIKLVKDEILGLNEELDIWKTQPGQFLIPWRKDHYGLNISEALELWKTSVLK
jgi:hypothetical protein